MMRGKSKEPALEKSLKNTIGELRLNLMVAGLSSEETVRFMKDFRDTSALLEMRAGRKVMGTQ